VLPGTSLLGPDKEDKARLGPEAMTYYVTAIVDTRRGKDWVLHGRRNRSGKFHGTLRTVRDKAVARWGKHLRGSESVVITSVRPIKG